MSEHTLRSGKIYGQNITASTSKAATEEGDQTLEANKSDQFTQSLVRDSGLDTLFDQSLFLFADTSSQMTPPPSTPSQTTVTVETMKVPNFIPKSPQAWVRLCKAQFFTLKITQEDLQYYRVLSGLSSEVMVDQVLEVINSDFAEGHMEKLFKAIIDAFTTSAVERLRDVLEHEEQGNRKPSVFFKALKVKVNDLNVSDDIFYDRWLVKLNPQVQTAVVAAKSIDEMTIENVLKIADNVYEHLLSSNSSSNNVSAIANQRSQFRNRSPSRDSNRRNRSPFRPNRSMSPSRASSSNRRFSENGSFCWYHFTFGKEARKCTKPCKYAKNNSSGNDHRDQ